MSDTGLETSSRTEGQKDSLAVLSDALRERRKELRLSIEQLALLSGVSKSAISKIERGEVAPSTPVLAKLAEALTTSIAELLAHQDEQDVVMMRSKSQPVIRDDETGLVRRILTPILPGRGIDWVLTTIPTGTKTDFFPAHRRGTEEYVYVQQGSLIVLLGTERYRLEAGDSIFFKAAQGHAFQNDGDVDCLYFLIIDSTKLRP